MFATELKCFCARKAEKRRPGKKALFGFRKLMKRWHLLPFHLIFIWKEKGCTRIQKGGWGGGRGEERERK
jgi:hypothetical protein